MAVSDEVAARLGDAAARLDTHTHTRSESTALFEDPELRQLLLGVDAVPDDTPADTPVGEDGETEEEDDAIARLAQSLPGSIDFTQTVLQDIEVLAVGPDTRPSPLGTGLEPAGAQIIILEVTPEQAEEIEFAAQYTSVSLSLIPSGENDNGQNKVYDPITSDGVIVDDLFTLIDRIRLKFEEAGVLLGNG